MSCLCLKRASEYAAVFVRLSKGHATIGDREVSRFLRDIGYCSDAKEALMVARDFIKMFDFSLREKMDLEDFLLMAEFIEMRVEELRNFFKDTLWYFCKRKQEQDSAVSFGLGDIALLAMELEHEDAALLLRDIEQDINQSFQGVGPSKNHLLGRKKSLFDDSESLKSVERERIPSDTASTRGRGMDIGWASENIVIPESTLIDILEKRLIPKQYEPVLHQQMRGHGVVQIEIASISLQGMDFHFRNKLQVLPSGLEFEGLNPVLAIGCGSAMAHSRPLGQFKSRQEYDESLLLEISLPSTRLREVIEWVDKTDLLISVFDFQEGGICPWTEWVGSAQKRLSWLLDNCMDTSPIPCKLPIENMTPKICGNELSSIECTISFPSELVFMWHAARYHGTMPDLKRFISDVRKGLNDSRCESINLESDLYASWCSMTNIDALKFPRRHFQALARDENGNVRFLPAFVQSLPCMAVVSDMEAALAVSLLDTGLTAHCDSAQSVFHLETILPLSIGLHNGQMSSLEAAILLWGLLSGLGHKNLFICVGDDEIPWVMSISENNSSHEQETRIQPSKEEYCRFDEHVEMLEDRSAFDIKWWNPRDGSVYVHESEMGPRRIFFAFNDENLWLNVQNSVLVSKITLGNIGNDSKKWSPVSSGDSGLLPRVYAAPDVTGFAALEFRDQYLETKVFLSDLVDSISLYRRHRVFVPDTIFDSGLSKQIQEVMTQCIHDCGGFDLGKRVLQALRFENSLPMCIFDSLPVGHLCKGAFFELKGSNIQRTMMKLEEAGVLNHSFPDVCFVVAAIVRPAIWDLSTVYVFIGVVHAIKGI